MGIPSGEHTKNYGKSPFSMGKSTISMAIFHSFLLVHQRVGTSAAMGTSTKNLDWGNRWCLRIGHR